MLRIILFLVVGSVLAYVLQHNQMPVSVTVGPYILANIPLFYVIVGSLLAGLGLSYVIYLIHEISMSFLLRGKDHELKNKKNEVLELTKRVHQLELENEKLKKVAHIESKDRNAL